MIIKKNLKLTTVLAAGMTAALLLSGCGISDLLPGGGMSFENGMAQPMLDFSYCRDEDYSNADSDILRFCVYVETDNDTDGDGMADLVKVFMQVPKSAVKGKYKAATIYDPTPYSAGTVKDNDEGAQEIYVEEAFDYDSLDRDCSKRTPEGEMSTVDAAAYADPADWNYTVPGDDTQIGYGYSDVYDYFLIRGFAVAEASGIGTCGSEGYELCGLDLERDCHKCVVEWLAGDRTAYTDTTQNIEIKADWSNGNVAMTGCSYGGTLPFEVATTGVKGLKTIIPFAGIASWYDYTNSQGVPITFDVNYADYLAALNCGGTYLDNDWTVLDDDYGSFLWQIAQDEEATNGDYAPVWEWIDYSKDTDKINCSALIVQGLNDYNVLPKQADLMAQAFEKAGKPYKLILHQDGHTSLDGREVNGELWEEIMNKWLCRYLYDIDNGIEDMPEVTAQSNIDGTWKTYDHWRDFDYIQAELTADDKDKTPLVDSKELAKYAYEYFGESMAGENADNKYRELYYTSLEGNLASGYTLELPEDTTVYGVPEVHVKLSTDVTDKDGLMVTAALVDEADNGEPFKAYIIKNRLGFLLPVKTVGTYEMGGGLSEYPLNEYVQSSTEAKIVSTGWTDLNNYGLGYDSSEYTESKQLEAGKFYDYTLYLQPAVYTVAPGHHLKLVITGWDPYRAFLDEDFMLDPTIKPEESDYTYSFRIDNSSIKVMMPVAKK